MPVLYDFARLRSSGATYCRGRVRLQRVIEKNPTHSSSYQFRRIRASAAGEKASRLAEFKRLEALEKQVKQERIMDEKLRTQQMLGQTPQQ